MEELIFGMLLFVIGIPVVAIMAAASFRLFVLIMELGERIERRLLNTFDERNKE